VQAQYDAARDLQEALAAAGPVGRACRPLLAAARALADAEVMQVEGYDRPWPALASSGVERAVDAHGAIATARPRCRPGPAPPRPAPRREPASPRSGEAFFGVVEAPVLAGATHATIRIVVLLTYLPGISLAGAQRLGSRALRAAGL
jgi:hypothetical protein